MARARFCAVLYAQSGAPGGGLYANPVCPCAHFNRPVWRQVPNGLFFSAQSAYLSVSIVLRRGAYYNGHRKFFSQHTEDGT
jgi:hypothetical protein